MTTTIKKEVTSIASTDGALRYITIKKKKKNDDVGGAEKIFPSGIDDRD